MTLNEIRELSEKLKGPLCDRSDNPLGCSRPVNHEGICSFGLVLEHELLLAEIPSLIADLDEAKLAMQRAQNSLNSATCCLCGIDESEGEHHHPIVTGLDMATRYLDAALQELDGVEFAENLHGDRKPGNA